MTDRSDIEALLPFYANGTLSEAERAEVEAALRDDPALELELSSLRAMRDTLQAEETRSPGEFGLARLMRSVEEEGRSRGSGRGLQPARLWRIAAVIAIAAFLAQSVFLLDRGGPGYELAGDGAGAVRVTFDPGATEAEIRAFLTELELEITGGPSALGLYDIMALDGEVSDEDMMALQASPLIETATRDD